MLSEASTPCAATVNQKADDSGRIFLNVSFPRTTVSLRQLEVSSEIPKKGAFWHSQSLPSWCMPCGQEALTGFFSHSLCR